MGRQQKRPPEIHIVAGLTFTTARVGAEVVAVKWGQSAGNYFVSNGTGAAEPFHFATEAAGELLRLAIAARDARHKAALAGKEN